MAEGFSANEGTTPASSPIDELLAQTAAASAAGPSDPFAGMTTSGSDSASIEELLRQANFDEPSSVTPDAGSSAGFDTPSAPAAPFELPSLQQVMQDAQASSIDLLRDVELNVKIELGRARMMVEDVLKLGEGSVVELDKLAGDPVDVFVNEKLVARGEVLVLNDNFCVRVNEIVAGVKEEGL